MLRPTQLIQFTENLWVVHSQTMEYFNAGAWISQGQALLIDPGVLPAEIDLLAQAVRQQGAEPFALLVTHSHWDHVLGPEHFPGLKVLAQAHYPHQIAQYAYKIKYKVDHWEKEQGVDRTQPFVVPQPTELIGQQGEVRVGALTLQLQHVPGHAADQLAVYDPASQTIWTSDILCDTEIPFVSDNLLVYEQTLATLVQWPIAALVPGHGWETKDAANIHNRFVEDRAYLAAIHQHVEAALKDGISLPETSKACADIPYRLKDEMTPYHQLNVESAYLELGGQADPHNVGWARDWRRYAQD